MGVLALLSKLKIFRRGESGVPLDPDDRWSNLYREREKNILYRWVGMRTGGELIGIYEKEGEEGVLAFAQEKMEPMMYNDGHHPQLIKYGDFMRWKRSVNTALGIAGTNEELKEENTKFREHEAQWRLNKRGIEGETIIHLLLNREEPFCVEIARILIQRYPGLSKDIYLGDEMFGQSTLHLAIVHNDHDTVQLLLESGADVNARACGTFFLPERKANGSSLNGTDYEGYAYYGEYPLAFAACFEDKDIYDLLIEHGAQPDLQDTFGNTCLHMSVINYSAPMYSYAVRHWQKPATTNIANHSGLTPLTLASKLGRKQIFEEMLELMKVEFWRFANVTCSAYPLDTLDTIRPDGSTNYDSALMTVINGSTPEHLEMIGSEVIQRLLADKWKAYASRKLYERLALLIIHLICLSFVVYLRPTDATHLYFVYSTWEDRIRGIFEVLTILGCCWFVFIQQLDELRTQGIYSYTRNLLTAPAKVVFIGANLCILTCVPFRFFRMPQVEESLLVFALPGSWIFLLFFARSAKLTGPFVQMIYSMIAGDMIRFAIISSIFIISFSQVFYFVGKDIWAKQLLPKENEYYCPVQGYKVFAYSSYPETFVTIFRAMMGNYDYEEFSCTNYETLTKALFVLYLFVMPIMMINILIAMMGNTYMTIILQAEKAWRQQYAQIVMVLERSMNRKHLANSQLEYSILLNSDPGKETRGLMVIKETKKTKATQRKQAIINWKFIGRKVIHMTKEFGAAHAKFLLHSHDKVISDDATVPNVVVGATGGLGVPRVNRSPSNDTSVHFSESSVFACTEELLRRQQHSRLRNSIPKLDDPIHTTEHQTTGLLIDSSFHAVVSRVTKQQQRRQHNEQKLRSTARQVDRESPSECQRHYSINVINASERTPSPSFERSQSAADSTKDEERIVAKKSASTSGMALNVHSTSSRRVHLAHRASPVVAGSKVRGFETLPSDVPLPNIPSKSRMSISSGTAGPSSAVIRATDAAEGDSPIWEQISRHSQPAATPSHIAKPPPSEHPLGGGVGGRKSAGIRVTTDIFRKKDSASKKSPSSSPTDKQTNEGHDD